MNRQNMQFKELLRETSIIPVMVIDNIEDAVPMARRMVAQGYKVLEITLRTECAFEAISLIAKEVPDAIVGVGTVTNAEQLVQSFKLGAKFAVSPGSTDELLEAAEKISMPLLPGVSTASEAMTLLSKGYMYLKLFPAEVVGGRAMLKSLSGPLPDLKFCPTGGIDEALAKEYLKLSNVICVGGSWMTKPD